MEDAMIINKSSYERGFSAGMIYKAQFIDLFQVSTGKKARSGGERDRCDLIFERDPAKPFLAWALFFYHNKACQHNLHYFQEAVSRCWDAF